ncbi:hypothetical protein TUM17576_16090 [Enterobacter hormaechei]|nr:hypothetical protein TUM17576_16090 [Enterobacter hormaechei]
MDVESARRRATGALSGMKRKNALSERRLTGPSGYSAKPSSIKTAYNNLCDYQYPTAANISK